MAASIYIYMYIYFHIVLISIGRFFFEIYLKPRFGVSFDLKFSCLSSVPGWILPLNSFRIFLSQINVGMVFLIEECAY